MGLMTGQHPSIPYPTPTSSMPAEALVAQGAGSPALCPLAAAYDSRLLGAPVSAYTQHRFNVAELYGNSHGPYPDSAVAAAAAAAAAAGYVASIAPSHPAAMLYPTSLTAYDIKDPRTAWTTLPQAAGYPCDPTLAAYGAYGDRFDPVDSEARRRNATRETTSTLKAWLNEHRKNPYPTKGEKIMLAIITKMTLTQVSTWFANARRRLKKENKMTWEPRNKTNDDLDDVSIEDDDEEDDKKDDAEDDINIVERKSEKHKLAEDIKDEENPEDMTPEQEKSPLPVIASQDVTATDRTSPKVRSDINRTPNKANSFTELSVSEKCSENPSTPPVVTKPKIWSLAQTAISDSPPPAKRPHLSSSSNSEDADSRMRMNRLLYHERLLSSELNISHFLQQQGIPRDNNSAEFHSRVGPHPDSSADSSLSSPPLWKNSEQQLLSAEKFGRLTPYDSSDLRSMSSSSSSGSPSTAPSSLDGPHASIQAGLSYSHARFLGCRLFPYSQDSGNNPSALPLIAGERFHHPGSSMGPSIDLRTIQSSFIRPSPYGCPVSFASAQANQTISEFRR